MSSEKCSHDYFLSSKVIIKFDMLRPSIKHRSQKSGNRIHVVILRRLFHRGEWVVMDNQVNQSRDEGCTLFLAK